jgi:N-acetyl-gamma-glutamyl-phosphate reductase
MFDVMILGASGYGGGELLRLLSGHPQVRSIRGTARSHAGKPFHALHPNLRGLVEGAFEAAPDWPAFKDSGHPVVFSALPHGELAKLLPEFETAWEGLGLANRLTLIDLSADFRLDPRFAYGLAEWKPERLKGARRIANPGCFATALQLALLPLAPFNPDFVAISAITGSSGSGINPVETAHHPSRAHDFRAYKMLEHQHEAEVRQTLRGLGWDPELSFVPHSAPLVRGIFATVQCRLPEGADLGAAVAACYQDAFFVRTVEGSPRVAAVTGSNFADVSTTQKGRSAVVMVTIDNLGKGMAGQAVQNLNLAFGLPEWTGLRQAGCYP